VLRKSLGPRERETKESCIMRSFVVYALQMNENENGRSCSTHGIAKNSYKILFSKPDTGTKYMIMSRHQNSGQNQNIRIANESLKTWQISNTRGLH
jgi:hypothetical protein